MSDIEKPIVEIKNLSRKFGTNEALRNVSISVASGQVFGLVGENGAGKTTLIRHILGLLRPQSGIVSVLGNSPVASPERVLAEIGYVSEDRDLPNWMSIISGFACRNAAYCLVNIIGFATALFSRKN